MGKQLFVIKAGAAPADGTTLQAIANGKAGFAVEGTSVTKAAIEKADKVQLIAKRADGSPEVSPVFSAEDIVKKSVITYSAGTAQASHITFVLPATQNLRDEYMVKIIDTTLGTRAPQVNNISVYHNGTDFTSATLIDAFVAKINDAKLGVTASVDNGKLKITADNTVTTFRLAVDMMAAQSVIEYTTSNIPAAGTPEVIEALESYLQSFGRGITNRVEYPVKTPESQVEAGVTYTLYIYDMLISTPDYAGVGSPRYSSYKMYLAEVDDTGVDGADVNHVGKVLAAL